VMVMPPESAITTRIRYFSVFLHSRFFGIKFRFTPKSIPGFGGPKKARAELGGGRHAYIRYPVSPGTNKCWHGFSRAVMRENVR
jgi:hypothetical protein